MNVTGSWEPNTDVSGSLMLRPKFGSGDLITSLESEIHQKFVTIYPNPVRESLKIEGSFDSVVIYTLMGKPILSLSDVNIVKEIDFSNLPNGLYLAEIIKGNQIQIERIIKF